MACTGDAIQCAIARIQKKQLCLSEFNDSEISSTINDNSDMSPLGTLPGDTFEVHVDDFLDTDVYVTSDNQCPDPISYTVLGVEYEIVLNPLCDLAGYIYYFITFATWFSMSILLAKSLGNG
ncbi:MULTISPECIES: virulence factor TspB C-terminal domain-related protein [unclassified Endozoicomonas]|uniref:virulence factor TspB C-terminal domain-related protein n=1 Tax=unclassified Endozoicomonas TaxID=2644528 RepID=UPI003BB74ADF